MKYFKNFLKYVLFFEARPCNKYPYLSWFFGFLLWTMFLGFISTSLQSNPGITIIFILILFGYFAKKSYDSNLININESNKK